MSSGIAARGARHLEAAEARCRAATAGIDAAIDDVIPVMTKHSHARAVKIGGWAFRGRMNLPVLWAAE